MNLRPLIVIILLAACSGSTPSAPPPAPTKPICEGATAPTKLRETTNPSLSGWDVGISNIFARDGRMSAQLSIHEPSAPDDAVRREIVHAGTIFQIDADRYCVLELSSGTDGPGWLTVGKL